MKTVCATVLAGLTSLAIIIVATPRATAADTGNSIRGYNTGTRLRGNFNYRNRGFDYRNRGRSGRAGGALSTRRTYRPRSARRRSRLPNYQLPRIAIPRFKHPGRRSVNNHPNSRHSYDLGYVGRYDFALYNCRHHWRKFKRSGKKVWHKRYNHCMRRFGY